MEGELRAKGTGGNGNLEQSLCKCCVMGRLMGMGREGGREGGCIRSLINRSDLFVAGLNGPSPQKSADEAGSSQVVPNRGLFLSHGLYTLTAVVAWLIHTYSCGSMAYTHLQLWSHGLYTLQLW